MQLGLMHMWSLITSNNGDDEYDLDDGGDDYGDENGGINFESKKK